MGGEMVSGTISRTISTISASYCFFLDNKMVPDTISPDTISPEAKALPNLQRPKVGQIKPRKWAKRSCQTQSTSVVSHN